MKPAKLLLVAGAVFALGGCTETRLRLSPDFGESVKQDVMAQTADPDAHYDGVPGPGSSGQRAASAQDRYNKGQVTPPAATSTSSATAGGGGSGGQGGSSPPTQ